MSSCDFEFAALDVSAATRFAPMGAPAPAVTASPVALAQAEAEALVAAARAEAEQLRTAAYAEGHAEGLAAGQAEGSLSADELSAALSRACDQVLAGQQQLAAELEQEAVVLAFALAEKVLMGALDVETERVLDVIRGALRGMMERERVTLLVNPSDMELVREHAPQIAAELGAIEALEVMAERRVSRGGAIIRTAEGELDATVETKLARAREVIAGELGA